MAAVNSHVEGLLGDLYGVIPCVVGDLCVVESPLLEDLWLGEIHFVVDHGERIVV